MLTVDDVDLVVVIPPGDLDILHEYEDFVESHLADEAIVEPGETMSLDAFERELKGSDGDGVDG